MNLQEKIKNLLLENGAADVGFAKLEDGPFGESSYAVSIVVRLSQAVIDEIENEPTHTYFHHYRTVNALIDQLSLKAGFLLENSGYSYIPIAASQSVNKDGWHYKGRYSHKKAAAIAGLGGVGKSSLFLHNSFGAAVRLGTVLTDCPFEVAQLNYSTICNSCDECVRRCPSGAIKGELWQPGLEREDVFDPQKCSEYMKNKFKHIGRGAVCGICIKACPVLKGKTNESNENR